jgi:hypothetical protein
MHAIPETKNYIIINPIQLFIINKQIFIRELSHDKKVRIRLIILGHTMQINQSIKN